MRRRHSRRIRSNRRTSRGVRRNPDAAFEQAIGRAFAKKRRSPIFGRIKRVFDKPSVILYYGDDRAFFKQKPQDAENYARRLGYQGEIVPNVLVSVKGTPQMSPKLAPGMYQVVETTEGSRMWGASYPITMAAYQTTGYLRDFKFGGIAKRKANLARGKKIDTLYKAPAEKRKSSRRVR